MEETTQDKTPDKTADVTPTSEPATVLVDETQLVFHNFNDVPHYMGKFVRHEPGKGYLFMTTEENEIYLPFHPSFDKAFAKVENPFGKTYGFEHLGFGKFKILLF
jgi:hypothetical protein